MSETETDRRLLSGYWQVVAERGFVGTTMRAVAARAEVPLEFVRRRCPDRLDMLRLHQLVIDSEVLAGTVPGQGGTPRDRVFDVLMRRVDALQPHRRGITRLSHTFFADPAVVVSALAGLPRSMGWMLEAAELRSGGAADHLRGPAIGLVWLATARAWLEDDTTDLGATMAALDRALDKAEQVARTIGLRTPNGT